MPAHFERVAINRANYHLWGTPVTNNLTFKQLVSSVLAMASSRTRLVLYHFLASAAVLLLSSSANAQVATVDMYALRDFVFQNGDDPFLEIITRVDNPTLTDIAPVTLVYTMPEGVDLSSVDSPECVETVANQVRTVTCTLDEVSANTFTDLSFLIDGPNSTGAGPAFNITLTPGGGLSVISPTPDEQSLADGERLIRGTPLTIHVVRNLAFDGNQNGLPDVDEGIIGLFNLPLIERLNRDAVIDLLFIYSPSAAAYLDGHLEERIDRLVTAANQTFRDNGIDIIFNSVGLEEVNYTEDDASISDTLIALRDRSDPSLLGVDNFITSSGGDIVVFLHALDSSPLCGVGASVGISRQGDFQAQYHRGTLLNAIDVGPTCAFSIRNIAAFLGLNMGVVNNREASPSGGTYSFSAGYGVNDDFATLMTSVQPFPFGSAEILNEFSSPDKLCDGQICGVDSEDLALGADAIKSLQLTRHVVSDLTDSIFSIDPTTYEEKRTLITGLEYPVVFSQSPTINGGFATDFIPFEVSIENQSQETLRSLLVNVFNIHDLGLNSESQVYRVPENQCAILGSNLTTQGTIENGVIEKAGVPHCFIDAIAPGETAKFTYSVQIDATPPNFSVEGVSESYYQQGLAMNGLFFKESTACVPVYENFVDANAGNDVCAVLSAEEINIVGVDGLDITQSPSVNGSTIDIPFLRLFDNTLITAEFRIVDFGSLELELVEYEFIDNSVSPNLESFYSESGFLVLRGLVVGTETFNVEARIVPDSNPIRFNNVQVFQIN